MYADAIVYATFEKDSYCATALYGDNGDGTVSVHNYATIGSPTGSTYVSFTFLLKSVTNTLT